MNTIKTVKVRDWINALRSGEYRQGLGKLRIGGYKESFCCLGVLAHLKGATFDSYGNCSIGQNGKAKILLDGKILNHSGQAKLAKLNDYGSDFNVIADYIEKRYDLDREL